MDEVFVGEVTHYYPKINVAVISIVEQLNAGDSVRFKSPESRTVKVDFEQKVGSMEIEHQKIEVAEPGQVVAIRVNQRVRKKDRAYKKIK